MNRHWTRYLRVRATSLMRRLDSLRYLKILSAPRESNSSASSSPSDDASDDGPLLAPLTVRVPSGLATKPLRFNVSPSIRACAAIGTRQPPPSPLRKARSALQASPVAS